MYNICLVLYDIDVVLLTQMIWIHATCFDILHFRGALRNVNVCLRSIGLDWCVKFQSLTSTAQLLHNCSWWLAFIDSHTRVTVVPSRGLLAHWVKVPWTESYHWCIVIEAFNLSGPLTGSLLIFIWVLFHPSCFSKIKMRLNAYNNAMKVQFHYSNVHSHL